MSYSDSLTPRDIAQLAALHASLLPGSMLCALPLIGLRCFYRFVSRSTREELFVVRNDDGALCAAAILTFSPSTLMKRFLLGRHIWLSVFLAISPRVWSVLPSFLKDVFIDNTTNATPAAAELIYIYTAPLAQSSGLGASLLARIEHTLTAKRHAQYVVWTQDNPANRAIAFYEKNGFAPVSHGLRFGQPFVCLKKNLTVS